ncbi:hypothetical protein MKW94_027068 [Papaver nudicaule]|uniref:Uncharacterized protein n=1 Tax=Papaver nudicaule TaxID=74823 RepID=A0AA41UVS9_PAPNU|nr:hypothetical protein [Papaver nudicaule]
MHKSLFINLEKRLKFCVVSHSIFGIQDVGRGSWTATEDGILSDYIKTHGDGDWSDLPTKAGIKRSAKACRHRWFNYLRSDIMRGTISRVEQELIIRLQKLFGNNWPLIAGILSGRTANEIQNYWEAYLAKKIQDHSTSSSTRKSCIKFKVKKRTVTGTSVETQTQSQIVESRNKIQEHYTSSSTRKSCIKFRAKKRTVTGTSVETRTQSQIAESRDRNSGSTDQCKEMDLESRCPLRGRNLLQNNEMDGYHGGFSEFSPLWNFRGDDPLLYLNEMLQNWTGDDFPSDIDIESLIDVLGPEEDWLEE